MMAEGDGLGRLQVREARHDRAGMRLGLARHRQHQRADLRADVVERVAHPHLEVERDLVVARARRVQPPRRRADQLGEAGFDVHVNVFERAREREGPGLDFAGDLV